MSNGLNNAAMVIAANALRSAAVKMHLHSADPGGSGTSNLTAAASQAVTWAAASGSGNFGLASTVAFTGVTANGACQWVSLWDTGETTWYGNFQLTGDQTANSSGQYNVTTLDLSGSAS